MLPLSAGSTYVDIELLFVIVPDDPIDDLGDGDVLSFCLGFNSLDKRFFDMKGPPLSGSWGVVGLGQEVLAPAAPGQPSVPMLRGVIL